MCLIPGVLAAVVLATLPPIPKGSIQGKVIAKPSHYVTQSRPENGFARRHAFPAVTLQEPLGVVVALEGKPLQKEKFAPPAEEVRIEWRAMGLEPRIVGCMIGSPLAIHNGSDRVLKLVGDPMFKEPIPAGETRILVLDEVGVFQLHDEQAPDARVTLVVNQNPHIVTLDASGEFSFADLAPGAYTLKVYGRQRAQQLPVVVKADESEQVTIALKNEPAAKADTP